MKNYAAAKDDFTSAIKLNSTNSYFYYNRALCSIELGQMKSALSDLKKVTDKSLKQKALFLKGRANYRLYNYDTAEKIFNDLLKQNPDDEEAILYLARIRTNRDMYDEAISLCRLDPLVKLKAYEDPEWQANAFGGELLASSYLIQAMMVH